MTVTSSALATGVPNAAQYCILDGQQQTRVVYFHTGETSSSVLSGFTIRNGQVVDQVVDKKGTRDAAESFLKFIYSREGQTIAAKNHYRPRDPAVAKEYAASFPNIQLMTIADFGGWQKAQTTHFNDHGVFDSIYGQ